MSSNYHFECLCGQAIVSHAKEAQCPKCGRKIRVEWPAKESKSQEPKTITEEYERR